MPGPLRIPGVLPALAWLTHADEAMCARDILKASRRLGLLPTTPPGELWKCDGPLLEKLVKTALRECGLPSHGQILIGIGELKARGHVSEAEFESDVGRVVFDGSFSETVRLKLIAEALDVAHGRIITDQRGGLDLYEKQTISVSDWSRVKYAYDWVRNPPPPVIFAGYGLGLIANMVLRCAPNRLNWLIDQSAARGLLFPVLAALAETCMWDENMASSALESGVPFIVGFGLGRLQNWREDGEGEPASSIDAVLAKGKVPDEGRRYVAAVTLKECVHAWYRQKERFGQARLRQNLLREDPDQATGGARYAINEIERLEASLPALQARRDAVTAKLEDALSITAALDAWPEEHWAIFEPSFVDTPDIRFRFAMKHADGGPRQAALKACLDSFDELLGTRRAEKAIYEDISTARADPDIAYWAARAQIELSNIKGTDLGRDAARRIHLLEKAVRTYTQQPFAAARFGQHFQDALTRWSLLLQFAFRICASSQDRRLITLRDLALASTQTFLRIARRSIYTPERVEAVIELTADAVLADGDDLALQWLHDERMPALLRASLAWSSASILQRQPDLARILMDKCARGTSRTLREWNASTLINLLDRAAATAYRDKRTDIISMLEIPYSLAVSCGNAPMARCVDLAMIVAAVGGDPIAQRQMMDDPMWSQSRTAHAFATVK